MGVEEPSRFVTCASHGVTHEVGDDVVAVELTSTTQVVLSNKSPLRLQSSRRHINVASELPQTNGTSKPNKKLLLNAFNMFTPSHLALGQ
jgi:hypothetical protein